jgi:hypothetical protein
MSAATLLPPVRLDARLARAYPWLAAVPFAPVGVVIVDEASGVTVRTRADGGVDEVAAVPRRSGISADPTAARRP